MLPEIYREGNLPFEVVDKKPVTFILGDNMEYLRWCKKNMMFKYFHVGIVDPPYGISVGDMNLGSTQEQKKAKKYEMGEWDHEVPTQEYWELLWYCCRNLVIWGGNYFTNEIGKADIPSGRCFIFWDKLQGYRMMAHGELALTTFDKNAVKIEHSRGHLTKEDGDRRHPTMKPVYLYDYIHLHFVDKMQRVLDTHGGSHTHAIAAGKNNVNLTIIERQKSYHDDGVKNYIEQIEFKPRLF